MVVFMKWIYTLLMVLGEAIALRKFITAGHSEQEFPWCCTETVMGPARMVLNLCKGEESTMNEENSVFGFFTFCNYHLFFFPDSQTANPIWQGAAGLEKDVLQAHKVLPTEGAVWWHTAAVQALPHPLLEGMKCWWDCLGWDRGTQSFLWLQQPKGVAVPLPAQPSVLPQLLRPFCLASDFPIFSTLNKLWPSRPKGRQMDVVQGCLQ